jgi:ComF family protein
MSIPLSGFIHWVLDCFAPRDCLGCSKELRARSQPYQKDSMGEWCPACFQELEHNRAARLGDCALIAPWRHAGPLRDAIHRLKYEQRSDYAARLVRAGFAAQHPDVTNQIVLAPVPLHPARLVERGYNQSALVASALSRRWRVPVAFNLLMRVVATKPQVGQGRASRTENVRDAFLARSLKHRDVRVWLVDDVVTTGATVSSCRNALDRAGIALGGVIALAHASSTTDPRDLTVGS